MNIPILFEDEYLIVVDKPSGLLTIPTPKNESRTLTSILNQEAQERKAGYHFHPCHRLDRDTSGAIIYAKGKAVQQRMMEEFKARQVHKVYIAMSSGTLEERKGSITTPVEGQHAITNFRVIEKRRGYDLIELTPITGRTNQIRIHMRQAGHPVLGDTKFAFRKDFSVKAKRLMLHAYKITFPHPVSGERVEVKADFPMDFHAFLQEHK